MPNFLLIIEDKSCLEEKDGDKSCSACFIFKGSKISLGIRFFVLCSGVTIATFFFDLCSNLQAVNEVGLVFEFSVRRMTGGIAFKLDFAILPSISMI